MTVVAIIGIDGSGKTTQAKLLVERLNKEGYNACYIRPIYVLLELIPLNIKEKVLEISFFSPRKVATSDCDSLHTSTRNLRSAFLRRFFMKIMGYPYVLITCLYLHFIFGRNKIVVCDRYFIQFIIDIYGENTKYILNSIPMPNLVFNMKGNYNLFTGRMSNSFDVSVKKGYYSNVLSKFEKYSEYYKFINIDASMSKSEISDNIFSILMKQNFNLKKVNV